MVTQSNKTDRQIRKHLIRLWRWDSLHGAQSVTVRKSLCLGASQ